jgi:hypothetical protein
LVVSIGGAGWHYGSKRLLSQGREWGDFGSVSRRQAQRIAVNIARLAVGQSGWRQLKRRAPIRRAIMRLAYAFPPYGRCRQRFAEWRAFGEPRRYRAVDQQHQARSRPHANNLRRRRKPRRALLMATQLSGCQCAEPFPSIDVSSLRNPPASRPPATARTWLCRVAQLTGSQRHIA